MRIPAPANLGIAYILKSAQPSLQISGNFCNGRVLVLGWCPNTWTTVLLACHPKEYLCGIQVRGSRYGILGKNYCESYYNFLTVRHGSPGMRCLPLAGGTCLLMRSGFSLATGIAMYAAGQPAPYSVIGKHDILTCSRGEQLPMAF